MTVTTPEGVRRRVENGGETDYSVEKAEAREARLAPRAENFRPEA